MLEIIWNIILQGLYIAGIYIAVSLGFSLVWGVMKIVNFAHGSLLMISMYSVYWLAVVFHLHPYVSVIIVTPILFLLGYTIQHYFLNPLFKRERAEVVEPLSLFIFTCGLMWFFDNLALLFFKADFRTIFAQTNWIILKAEAVDFASPRFLLLLVALIMVCLIHFLLFKTDLGKAVRATSQDRYAALLQGIPIYRIYSITFGLGAATLGIAGAFLLPFYPVFPTVGFVFLIKAFIIVVLGGIGSIWGVVIASIGLGIIETSVTQLISSSAGLIVIYLFFAGILIAKPLGLLGKEL